MRVLGVLASSEPQLHLGAPAAARGEQEAGHGPTDAAQWATHGPTDAASRPERRPTSHAAHMETVDLKGIISLFFQNF